MAPVIVAILCAALQYSPTGWLTTSKLDSASAGLRWWSLELGVSAYRRRRDSGSAGQPNLQRTTQLFGRILPGRGYLVRGATRRRTPTPSGDFCRLIDPRSADADPQPKGAPGAPNGSHQPRGRSVRLSRGSGCLGRTPSLRWRLVWSGYERGRTLRNQPGRSSDASCNPWLYLALDRNHLGADHRGVGFRASQQLLVHQP